MTMPQTFEFPAPVLSVAADAVRQLESGDALPRLWTVFTKCKSSLQDGRRLENISWRLWYREMAATSSLGQRAPYGIDNSGQPLHGPSSTSSSAVKASTVSAPSPEPHMTSQHQVNSSALDNDRTLGFNSTAPDTTVLLLNQQNALSHSYDSLIPSNPSPNLHPHLTISTRRNSFVGKIILDMLPNCIPALPPSPSPSQPQPHPPPRTPTSPFEHQITTTTTRPITSYFSHAIHPSSPPSISSRQPIDSATTATATAVSLSDTVIDIPTRPPIRCYLPTPAASEELIILPVVEELSKVELPLVHSVAEEKRESGPAAVSSGSGYSQPIGAGGVEVRVSEPSTPPSLSLLLPASASASTDVATPPLFPPRLVVVHPTPGPTPHPTPPATPVLGAGAGLSVNPPVPLSPALPTSPSPASSSGSHDTTGTNDTTSTGSVPTTTTSLGGEGSILSSSYTTSSVGSSDDVSTAVSSSGAGGSIDGHGVKGQYKVESPKPMGGDVMSIATVPQLPLLPPPMMQQLPLSVAPATTTSTTTTPPPPPVRRSSGSTSTGAKSSSSTSNSTKPRLPRAHGHVRKTSSASAGSAGKGGNNKLTKSRSGGSADVGAASSTAALLMTLSTGAGGGKKNYSVGVGVGKGRTLMRRTGSARGSATLGKQGKQGADKDKDMKLSASFDLAASNSDDGSAAVSKSTGSGGSSVSRVVGAAKEEGVRGKEKGKSMTKEDSLGKCDCTEESKPGLVVAPAMDSSSSSQPALASQNALLPPPSQAGNQTIVAHHRTLPDLAKLVHTSEQHLQQLLKLQQLHQLQQQRRTMVLATSGSEEDDDDYETETDSDSENVGREVADEGGRSLKAASATAVGVDDDGEDDDGDWSSEDMSGDDDVDVVLRRDDGLEQQQPPQPLPLPQQQERQDGLQAQLSAVDQQRVLEQRLQQLQQPQHIITQQRTQPPLVDQGQIAAPTNHQRVPVQQHLHQLQQLQQLQRPQQHQNQQLPPNLPPLPQPMSRAQQSRRDQAARAQYVVEQAALEAERIRDMFTKKPVPSSEQLKEEWKRTRSTGLLTQLMNPDPNIFPPGHPYRRGQSSGAIRQPVGMGAMGISAVMSAGAGAAKAKAGGSEEKEKMKMKMKEAAAGVTTVAAPAPASSAGQVKPRVPAAPAVAPLGGRKPQERKPSVGMAPSLRLTKSSAAGPVASQVQVGSVTHGRRPSDVAAAASGGGGGAPGSGQVGLNHPTSGGANGGLSGGYRPKGRPADLEMEDDSDSDDEGTDGRDSILVSKSVAQEKLNAFAQRRGIIPNSNSNSNGQKDATKASGEEEAEPVPDWIREPEVTGNSKARRATHPPRVSADAGDSERLQQPQEQQQQQQQRPTPTPIPFGHPYNLPPAAPPSTPRTTRRLMLQHEMSESLRRNLLWERQVSKISLVGFRRSSSSGGGGGGGRGGGIRPLTGLPNVVQLTAKKPEGSGNGNENGAVRPEERVPDARKMEEQKKRALARNRSWDYHYSGW